MEAPWIDFPFRGKQSDLLVGIMRKEKHGVCDPALNPEGVMVVSWYKYQSSESPLESPILYIDNPLLFYKTIDFNGLAPRIGKYSIFSCRYDHVCLPPAWATGGVYVYVYT